MASTAASVRRTYYVLTAGTTLAASLIWGINTIFLLDAGLSNFEAFAANAFFTVGMVVFEIPTGIVADSWGRRASFLCGTVALALSTGLYVLLWRLHAGFGWWALSSALLGLGFTFFSGATEAWLVDALTATKFTGELEGVFARAQVVTGVMMLTGSAAGGYLAQLTNLGAPYVARAAILVVVFVLALVLMRDLGFTPERGGRPLTRMRTLLVSSVNGGLKVPPIRALMISGMFSGGVGIYVFYALQPYLLQLWGNPKAYGVAGLVAAIVAGAQIAGGALTSRIRHLFRRRTSALLAAEAIGVAMLLLIGLVPSFAAVVAFIVIWALVAAASRPIRQAYLNAMIPSAQRATILSFDSLMTSAGGVVAQPALGRSADVWGYPVSYLFSAAGSALSLPFLLLARRLASHADTETALPPEPEIDSAEQIDA
jgi:MFS family permease